MTYLWIALGSALGGIARFWCSGFVADRFGGTFPWGTLLVNVVGSFIIGFFATLTGPDGTAPRRLGCPAVRHGRLLRRLHDLLLVQPADPDPGPGRRVAAGRRQHPALGGLVPGLGLARPRCRQRLQPTSREREP